MTNLQSNNLDVELVRLLTNEHTSEDEKQFVTKFQLYLPYSNDHAKFVVNLEDVWESLGFTSKSSAKSILFEYCIKDEEYIVQISSENEVILMNVATFKGLAVLSYTDKGRQASHWFLKMKTIFFKYLEDKNNLFIENLKSDLKRRSEYSHQETLINIYKDMPCIYTLRISDEKEGEYLVRLGTTNNIKQRMIDHTKNFKYCTLLDVFPCKRPRRFEQYLLKKQDIKNTLQASKTVSITKVFAYTTLTNIIQKHIDVYNITPFDMALEVLKKHIIELENLERIEIVKLLPTVEDADFKEILMKSYKKLSRNAAHMLDLNPLDEEKNTVFPISSPRL